MDEFLELMQLVSTDTPITESGHLPPQLNDFSDYVNDNNLKVYVENLKSQHPDKPIVGGNKIITNVMKPGLPTPSPADEMHKKVPWYLSKLCQATYKTRLCSRENSNNEPFLDNLAGQVLSKTNTPQGPSSLEKERIIRFNKEVLKIYINSEEYLEEREPGSSPKSLAIKAHEDFKINLKEPPVLKKNIGLIFTPTISYVLTDSGGHSLPQSVWDDIANIYEIQAKDSVTEIITNLYSIGKAHKALSGGLDPNNLSSTATYHSRSIDNVINQLRSRSFSAGNRALNALPGWEALNKKSKSVTYIYLGGGIVMVIIAGATFYLRTTDRQLREPQNLMEGIRGVGTALGRLLIASSKK